MRYGYTPDGKMRYEAAKKMTGLKPAMPEDPKPTKPKAKKKQPSKTKPAPKMMGY